MPATVLRGTADTIEARWKRVPLFWRAQTIGWGLFAVVDLVDQGLTYDDPTIGLVLTLLITPCLVLLSTGMRSVYASRSLDSGLTPRVFILIALCSIGAALIVVAISFAIRQFSGWTIPDWNPVEEVVVPLGHFFVLFVGWSLAYFWIHAEIDKRNEHRRAVAAETDALRAELQQLRLQLDPHFLFNALNGVAEEIPERPSAALAMLRDLAAYLRHSLASIGQTVVTVEAEVAALAAYLRVQEARFGTRLRTRLHADPAAISRHIASFLLQPLVENAVKHGRRENGLDVGIDIRLEGTALTVEIENTGSLDTSDARHRLRPAIGLENVRRRLALHYPGRHQFTLSGCAEGKVVARLVLEGVPCSGS